MTPYLTIVIPSFNERPNVRPLLAKLEQALDGVSWEAVYVDDDSPDGTADEVRAMAIEGAPVRLIHRVGRRGLAGACIEGILSATSPLVAVIDADMQHDETKLAQMAALMQVDVSLDLVIGSRFADGGSVGNGLSAVREWGSSLATRLAKRLLRIKASDPMSGYFMVRRSSFETVAPSLQTQGFKILADMLAAARGQWNVAEVGYTFRDRQHGESKLDAAITAEFIALLMARLTGGLLPIRLILFLLVGASGVIVQLAVMRLALVVGVDSFTFAQSLGVLVAMTTNFLLNNVLTYHDRTLRGVSLLLGLLSFYVVCSVGAVANVGVAEVVYRAIGLPELASLIGAIVGALWNFVASALVTWRAR